MQYLLMIYQAEEEARPEAEIRGRTAGEGGSGAPAAARAALAAVPATAEAPTRAEYDRFNEVYGRRGVLRGGAELQPSGSATTVRLRAGDVLLTDGPFAETKEQLAGYYVVECDTLDDAIEIAAAIPSARVGAIEVRPQIEGAGPSQT